MHSKWLDVGMQLSAFHMQSTKYDHVRPPAFGEYADLTYAERERQRLNQPTMKDLEETIDEIVTHQHTDETIHHRSLRHRVRFMFQNWNIGKSQSTLSVEAEERQESHLHDERSSLSHVERRANKVNPKRKTRSKQERPKSNTAGSQVSEGPDRRISIPKKSRFGFSDNVGPEKHLVHIRTSTGGSIKAHQEDHHPLLLQEGAHLVSLLSAVALATLRVDSGEAFSPLTSFTPGAPWPRVDPDTYSAEVRKNWTNSKHKTWTVLTYLMDASRTPSSQALYNAARPFRVIGGVSDAEIEMLQAARGPYAKVTLCTLWLQEFCSREHLNGGLGNIGAPIISRLFQVTSDGMLGYNQARKIACIPFPFPHAQITVLFVVVVVCLMPILMLSYVSNLVFGFVLNLLTVMSFTGVHAVARELENPFLNVPNDMPLNSFQAQFNEALMQMFAGFHPDAFWEICMEVEDESGDAFDRTSYPPTRGRLERMNDEQDEHENLFEEIPVDS